MSGKLSRIIVSVAMAAFAFATVSCGTYWYKSKPYRTTSAYYKRLPPPPPPKRPVKAVAKRLPPPPPPKPVKTKSKAKTKKATSIAKSSKTAKKPPKHLPPPPPRHPVFFNESSSEAVN